MGCNCGKNRKTAQQAREEQAKTPQANQQSTMDAQTRSAPKAAGSKGTQSFTLRLNTGKTMTFGSRLEAEAENVRQGYRGTIRPA